MYSNDALLYEVSYDIKSESTGITRDPIEISLSKDRITGYYTLAVCFQNKADADIRFEIYVEGENKTPALYMKSFNILKSFENEVTSEKTPALSPQEGNLNPQYAPVKRVQTGNDLVLWLVIAAACVVAGVVATVIIVVRKRGKKG